jgi:response regulator RpfG family c-di-GMP phosphodiesterase
MALQLLAFVHHDGIDEPMLLSGAPDLGFRVARVLSGAARPRGGSAFRVSGWTYATLVPAAERTYHAALDLANALDDVPLLARRLVHAEVIVPTEATGRRALELAFERLRTRARWQPLSAARQTRDVLLELLGDHRGGRVAVHRPDVASNALVIGRRLGLGLDELDDVVRAAELQDLGLLAMPEAILLKRTSLSAEDWGVIRNHPIVAERALSAAPALAPVARLVRSCYERWNGTGYPDGLHGEEIPLGARIIAVCVAFDAMVAGRPYRDAMSHEGALDELRRCSGRQFDPGVVDEFAALVGGERQALEAVA